MNFYLKKLKPITIVLCAVAAAFSLILSVGSLNTNKVYAATDVVIANAGFENSSNGKPDNWVTMNTTDGTSKIDVRFSVVSGDEAYNGKSLKCINNSEGDIRAVLDSARFSIEKKTTYKVSFRYNSTSASARTAICMRQFKSSGSDTNQNSWLWLDQIISGTTDGWRLVTMIFTTESDTAYSVLRADIAVTGEDPVYFDDFSVSEIGEIQFNGGMEQYEDMETPLGWVISNENDFSFSTDVYYDGKTSAHIVRNSLTSDFTMTSFAKVPVRASAYYDVGYRIKSQNSDGVRATVTVTYCDASGSTIRSLVSPYFYLKSDDGLSDWTNVWLRYIAPSGTTQVGISLTISKGVVDCYIDGVYCRESGDVAYIEDFESISESGMPDGFVGEKDMFINGRLVLRANKQASVNIDSLLYGMGYSMTGNVIVSGNAKPAVELVFFDYNGNKVDSKEFDAKGKDGEFLIEFTMPKATTCDIIYKNNGGGTVSFDNIRIDKTYDPDAAASGWEGKWVCYPYANPASGAQYRYALYRKKFTITEKPVSATIQLTGDDVITTWVNEAEIEDDGKTSWATILVADILEHIKVGENILAFRVYNQSSYGGILFDLELVFESGKKMRVYSDKTLISLDGGSTLNEDAIGNYKALDYDDSSWSQSSFVVGAPPCQPWGKIVYRKSNDVLTAVTVLDVDIPANAIANEKLKFSLRLRAENETGDDVTFKLNFRNKYVADEDAVIEAWLTPTLISGEPSENWKKGSEYLLTFEVTVPDYLDSDKYMLQFDTDEFVIRNVDYDGNIIRGYYFNLDAGERTLTESKIVKENGRVYLVVNGEKVAPMMYLREQKTVFKTEYASGMFDADVDLMCLPNCRIYNMNSNGTMWEGYGKYNFELLDEVVYETLQGAPSAKLMLMLDADPPTWWLRQNPGAYAVDSNGKRTGVSYASEKWREDIGVFYTALLQYVLKQPYASHIFAVKIGAGDTFEWQYSGQTLDACADFGTASVNGFRKWLTAKYGTDAALRAAWNKNNVSLASAAVPTYKERKATTYETLLDGKTQRNVIDFHEFMSDVTTDSILYFAEIVKRETNGKWIVGTYNGYITPALTYESAGLVNASIDRILKSDAIDFLCSPICYDERRLGMSGAYMMMVDSIIAAGKLPLIECDSRTVYQSSATTEPALLNEWGKTYTVKDSIEALKRDFTNMMIKGAGLWWYDMYGGWFDDPEIYSMFKTAHAEWQRSLDKEVVNDSRLAFIIGDDIVTTAAYSFDGTYHYLYQSLYMQKESLAHIGASYDMYYLSDVVDGLDKEYDVYLIVAFNITAEQRAGIDKYIKKNGKTVIWVGAPGIYGDDGSMSADYVSSLTGINLKIAPTSIYGISMIETQTFTKGLGGKAYGNLSSTKVKPMLYVDDSAASKLGTIYNSSLTGLAVKAVESSDNGYFFSIYSAVGDIPAGFIRNVLESYGAKLYDGGNNVIYKNSEYVSISSPYGGKHTLVFDRATDVYDVFKGEYIAKNVTSVEVEVEAGTCVLYRTEKHSENNGEKPVDSSSSQGNAGCGACNSSAGSVPFAMGMFALTFAAVSLLRKKRG